MPVQGRRDLKRSLASVVKKAGREIGKEIQRSTTRTQPDQTWMRHSHHQAGRTYHTDRADSEVFEVLFGKIFELYASSETPRKVPEERPSERALDDLFQLPIWELERTCSPFKETSEEPTPEKPRPLGSHTSRQLFPKDDRGNQPPVYRSRGPGQHAWIAPGRRDS